MTDTRHPTRPAGDASVPEDLGDPPVTALAARLYAFLYNKYVGVVIILVMAFATLLGTLLRQVPDSVRLDPASYAAWLESVQPAYGGWTPVLSLLGLFHVFSSWWFRAITVVLALSILACTTHRLPQLIARASRPHLHVTSSLFDHARYRSRFDVTDAPDPTFERVRQALEARHYRVLPDPKDARSLYADRFRWAPFGTTVAHLGFVVILVGVLVSSLFGFDEPNVPVTVGHRVAVGHDTGLTVEATAFSDTYYDDGRPKDYTSDLVLYRGQERVAAQTIRVNEPLRYDGVSFHQASFGVAAVITISDASGATLYSGGVPLERTSADGRDSYGSITVPGTGVVVYAAVAASGQTGSRIRPGQLLVELYENMQADSPFATQVLAQGTPATIDGVTYTFERESAFTGLLVNRDPGAPWVWVGSAMTVVGMCLTMLLRHRRVWARVEQSGTGASIALAAPERNDSVFERWFHGLVNDLGAAADASDRKGHDHAG